MDYVIIVNDNGELKTISATEFEAGCAARGMSTPDEVLNSILDARVARPRGMSFDMSFDELHEMAQEAVNEANT